MCLNWRGAGDGGAGGRAKGQEAGDCGKGAKDFSISTTAENFFYLFERTYCT